MTRILPSHPETNTQLLKRSFILYRESFTHVFFFALLVGIVVFIPRFISDLIGQDIFLNLHPLSPRRLWLFLIGLVGLIFFIAIIWRMHCVNRGYHEPFVEDFYIGLQKVFYVFIATIIQCAILVALSLILAVSVFLGRHQLLFSQHILGIIFTSLIFFGQFFLILYISILFIFLLPLIAIENKSILESIQRSVHLSWNHWWRIFSLQITPWLCYLFLLIIIKFILDIDIHIYFTEYSSHALWTSLLQFHIFILFIPWVAALLLVQLKDLELRKHIRQTGKNAI